MREITIDFGRAGRVHFVSKNFPATFSGGLTWQHAKRLKPGPHKIKVIVTDKLGNVATASITVVHTGRQPAKRPRARRRHH